MIHRIIELDEGDEGIAPDLTILVFGGPKAVADVVRALPLGQASEGVVVHGMPERLHGWVAHGEPIVCVGFGADGGAALARWVEARGLDGVTGVGLVAEPCTRWRSVRPRRRRASRESSAAL